MWKNRKAWIVLGILAVGIKTFSFFPDAVETYYSNGIYPAIAKTQRLLLGWIPFSVGDIFYAGLIVFLILRFYRMVRDVVRKRTGRAYWWRTLQQIAFAALLVYVSFNMLWGLNYNRLGVAQQLDLKMEKYTKEELVLVVGEVLNKLNALDSSGKLVRSSLDRKSNLFRGAYLSYQKLAEHLPDFKYTYRSVKPSLFSYLGNYLGYSGYYNPFSGEAQVNTTTPLFVQPFTTCHEIGHQLGYAKENEANFAGYLSARYSDNPAFRYSVYFDLYSYSRYYLFQADSLLARQLDRQLQPGVKADFVELQEYLRRHRNPVERIIDRIYGEYLKANNQPSGKLSYNEVIAWLVAYYKKYGKEAI